MLNDLPGMSSSSLGNASRPIIRGMANSRVKILQNSSSLSDVSEFGEDHIVGYDPMLIDKIEIIKGPGTLLYGNNGFAGVVNIINPLIRVDENITDQNVETNDNNDCIHISKQDQESVSDDSTEQFEAVVSDRSIKHGQNGCE